VLWNICGSVAKQHWCHINKTLIDLTSVIQDTIAMSKTSSIPLPAAHALRKLGRDLALARRKRGISTSDMAARLFVSRDTLWRLERGDPTVALGTLVTATFVLGVHDRMANLAAPASDELALSLDERRLPQRIRRQRP
jgi:DNA-binding XRE family transcriptional regulator